VLDGSYVSPVHPSDKMREKVKTLERLETVT
jgi:hypothetical protein